MMSPMLPIGPCIALAIRYKGSGPPTAAWPPVLELQPHADSEQHHRKPRVRKVQMPAPANRPTERHPATMSSMSATTPAAR